MASAQDDQGQRLVVDEEESLFLDEFSGSGTSDPSSVAERSTDRAIRASENIKKMLAESAGSDMNAPSSTEKSERSDYEKLLTEVLRIKREVGILCKHLQDSWTL